MTLKRDLPSDLTKPEGRLREARRMAGYASAAAVCEAFGWTYQTYLQHENGSRGFSSKSEHYARRFRVSAEWLLTGRGAMRAGVAKVAEDVYQQRFSQWPSHIQDKFKTLVERLDDADPRIVSIILDTALSSLDLADIQASERGNVRDIA